MNMNSDLDKKYDRFLGKKIAAVTVGTPPRSYQNVDDKDPVYLELAAEAVGDGLFIRTWFPKTIGTMDYRTDRLNVYLSDDGMITRLSIG